MLDSPIIAAAADEISSALLAAPAWARVALTMRDETMRERGAGELARAIVDRLTVPDTASADQLALPL